ncbi:MAG TPA: diguanylate cyclase [Syntrophomonadaceae bacterium]|nr:diguanylate cyclase [Syntrophomonadaceae bacterium]
MDYLINKLNKTIICSVIIIYILITFAQSTPAEEIFFTEEEKDFINKASVLKVISIDGIAPLSYLDSKGNIVGIGISLFDEISEISRLNFEYKLYESVADALDSNFDIYTNAEKKYAPDNMLLSQPYLESEALFYYNKSIDPKQLAYKRYAAIKGGTLPEGIKEEQAIYFNDREEAINAVESGIADFGYGNAYSLAFYTLQNGYENIITIPTGKEDREYCVGVYQGNEILLSILNKSIAAIDSYRMDAIVLGVASHVERKITFSMIVNKYGQEMLGILFAMIAILAYAVYTTYRAKQRIEIENKRYAILTQISNEYLFEYQIKSDVLHVSEKFGSEIGTRNNQAQVIEMFKKTFGEFNFDDMEESMHTIKLPLSDGDLGIFRMIFSYLKNESGKVHSVIGKLVDITREEKEKEKLIIKSQLDGLTGLYNATTTKEAIIKSMKNKRIGDIDALIIIDCDKFKEVNDKYGHLKGNIVLENIAKALKATFRQTDIKGRIGGDEFLVYMHNIPSVDFVHNRCQQLIEKIRENSDIAIAISVGVAICQESSTYEDLFQKADDALYNAKKHSGSRIEVYAEENEMCLPTNNLGIDYSNMGK